MADKRKTLHTRPRLILAGISRESVAALRARAPHTRPRLTLAGISRESVGSQSLRGERERLAKLVCAGGLQLGGAGHPLRGPAYLQHGGGELGVYALGAAEEGGRAAGADEGDDAQAKGPLVDLLAAAAALRPARRGLFDLIVVGTALERHCMYWGGGD